MKRLALLLAVSLFAFACEPEPSGRKIGDNSPTSDFNNNNETPDAGEDVGEDAEEDVEPCEPETDEEMCARLSYECGSLVAKDNCDVEREIESCGDEAEVCGEFATCGGDGAPGLCGCTPETNTEMCERLGYECGALDGVDNCGEPREIESCGNVEEVCLPLETCGGGGEEGRCGCTGQTETQLCQSEGFNCGYAEIQDACGRVRTIENCGPACAEPQTCGGGGEANVCGCTPKSDAELCVEHEAECGEITITDDCNVTRTINCGRQEEICTAYDTCGGGGMPNQCGCTPLTCASERIMCGPLFDGCGATIDCDGFCVQELEAGPDHACAVGSGNLRCWGRNNAGQLGTGNKTNQRNPATVTGLPEITTVSTAANNTCVVTALGGVYCWGANNRAQVGDGTTNERLRPVALPDIPSGATQVAVGDTHACALINGGVKCWGANDYGQIGNGLYNYGINVSVPTDVDGLDGIENTVVQITSGPFHTCALLDTHEVFCWGRNRYGQIGNLELNELLPIEAFSFSGTATLDEATRVNSPHLVDGLGEVVEITAGDDYTCALDVMGNVACWGSMNRPNSPACPVATGYFNTSGDPLFVNGGLCALFPGAEEGYPIAKHNVVLRTRTGCLTNPCGETEGVCNEDANRCEWYEYPLTTVYVDRAALRPTLLSVPAPVETFGAGSNHFCVVVEEEDVNRTNLRCMGRNNVGQIGDGTTNPWSFTVPIARDANSNIVRGTAIAPGLNHTCGLVSDANVKCWGSNQYSQIGNDALNNQQTYVPFDVNLVYEP